MRIVLFVYIISLFIIVNWFKKPERRMDAIADVLDVYKTDDVKKAKRTIVTLYTVFAPMFAVAIVYDTIVHRRH